MTCRPSLYIDKYLFSLRIGTDRRHLTLPRISDSLTRLKVQLDVQCANVQGSTKIGLQLVPSLFSSFVPVCKIE